MISNTYGDIASVFWKNIIFYLNIKNIFLIFKYINAVDNHLIYPHHTPQTSSFYAENIAKR